MVRLIPRRYRTIVTRFIVCFASFVIVCFFLSSEQATTGAGREDDPLFRLNYDANPDKLLPEDGVGDLSEGLPPGHLRGQDLSQVMLEEGNGNFTEPPLLQPQVFEYFTEDELLPWFDRPPLDPSAPGENGKGVQVKDPQPEVKELIEQGWKRHAFNQYVCDMISLHRTIEDRRDRECKEKKWRKPIPTATVIIIFHNEAWCTLLRTVHSVLETSPKVALVEVLLVDDASTNNDLGRKLDDYVTELEIVKVLRLAERSGLIRARLAGAQKAVGEVLIFLDSHCECAAYWMEPLLERIAEDPTRVVTPVIETIDTETFAMRMTSARYIKRGILSWALNFNWDPVKEIPGKLRRNDETVNSPTMAGGLFAINRNYFYHLGSYDKEMKVWGGENIEMSIRIWTCGGTLEIHPCSHVGHVFRKRAPYNKPTDYEIIARNSKRVAEVWLDEYKEEFYRRNKMMIKVNAGDLSDRISLRKRLKCHNFQWFLDNVYPELQPIPKENILKSGQWLNKGRVTPFCLDTGDMMGRVNMKVMMYPCHGDGGNQDFLLTNRGEIRHDHMRPLCLKASGLNVITDLCRSQETAVPANQEWEITQVGQIRNIGVAKCMEAKNQQLLLLPCRAIASQQWIIEDPPQ